MAIRKPSMSSTMQSTREARGSDEPQRSTSRLAYTLQGKPPMMNARALRPRTRSRPAKEGASASVTSQRCW
eukprot:1599738-Pyramimonas_sp.AAC.1